jgi:Cytochrome c
MATATLDTEAPLLIIRGRNPWIARAAIALGAIVVLSAGVAAAQTGKKDYDDNCAACHGPDGKGAGSATYVIPQINPADLTHITKRSGGTFPFDKVVASIDGRDQIPSHKRFDMPFWGVRFQEPEKEFTPDSEARVKQRIADIVRYIETMQEK